LALKSPDVGLNAPRLYALLLLSKHWLGFGGQSGQGVGVLWKSHFAAYALVAMNMLVTMLNIVMTFFDMAAS